MEVYFNELCLDESTSVQYQDISRLSKLYSCLKSKGIQGCRISQRDYKALIQQAKNMKGFNPNLTNFLFAFLRQPYEEEMHEAEQDEYLLHSWSYQKSECYGLALAFIMESMAVSICHEVWNRPSVCVMRDDDEINVRNLFDEVTFLSHVEWLDGLNPISLLRCLDEPEKKKIKLRDDHGKDKLHDYCERLVRCEYVCEIINSLPFHPGNRRFIHAVHENGLIELVLPWTNAGLGIVVRTTGRNKRETEAIAEILKERYCSV